MSTPRSNTAIVTVLVALTGVGCLAVLGVAGVAVLGLATLGGDGTWSASAIPPAEVPGLFGVSFPAAPVVLHGRELGFQDPYSEVLARLPAGSAERFLTHNHLARGPSAAPGPEILAHIDELAPGSGPFTAVEVEFPEARLPDGGAPVLFRRATLLEGPGGVAWIHLVAFGT